MKVCVGTRETGYQPIHKSLLEDYLLDISNKYEGSFVEENRKFIKDYLSGKDLSKYLTIGASLFYASLALLGLMSGDVVHASGGIINMNPLDKFFKEVYWTMFKVIMYVSTPVWAWVGIILSTSGANQEKRTLAKKIGTSLVVGTGISASAPWATRQLFNLWKFIFA